jgi:hypothetical protein
MAMIHRLALKNDTLYVLYIEVVLSIFPKCASGWVWVETREQRKT